MARTILLADDSVTIQKVVELTFLDEDFHVVSFGNGSDAIAALGEVRPDVVLADIHMPGADGYEVCAAARAAAPAVPVLLLVGTFEVFDAQRAAEAGAAGHLKKPFDSQELLRQVQALADSAPAPASAVPPIAAAGDAPSAEEAMSGTAAPAAGSDDGASWSFEPVGEGEVASAGEIDADTWAGVQAEELAAESVPPAAFRELSEADVDRIARRVVELLGESAVRDVAWEVVPDLAEMLLKARIEELEASVE